jgi:hypothetical protein
VIAMKRAHLTCPSCGKSAQNPGRCTHCGGTIDQRAIAGRGIAVDNAGVVVDGATVEIGLDQGETRECPHCGATVKPEAGKACPYCSGSLAIEAMEMSSLVVEEGGAIVISGGSLVIGGSDDDDDESDPT